MDVASFLSIPEGALFDRKERLLVVDEDCTNPEHKKHRLKLAKHLVALANFSRLSGEQAYLVFGIQDIKRGAVKPTDGKGILEHSAATSNKTIWPHEDNTDFLKYWDEHVAKPYKQFIQKYIRPRNVLKYNIEPLRHEDAVLALITIYRSSHTSPFYVEKNIDNPPLKHCYYIRVNDNTEAVEAENIEFVLTRWTDEPYLSRTTWEQYLENLKIRVIEPFPRDITMSDKYQDMLVQSLDGKEVGSFDAIWREKLIPNASSNRFIVFVGEPGAGKTWCLKRKIFEQAEATLIELTNDEKLREPATWIPVYIELRNYDNNMNFDQTIANSIATTIPTSKLDKSLIHARRLRFLVAIDAIDEVMSIEKTAQKINAFVASHGTVNNAVTGRETLCPNSWLDTYPVYRISSLSKEQIRSFLKSGLTQAQLSSPRLSPLVEELEPFLCIPRLLQAFANYLEGNAIPNSGVAIREILKKIKETERSKSLVPNHSFDDKWEFIFEYALICLEAEGTELFESQDHGSQKKFLHFYRNAGLLQSLVKAHNNMITFSHSEYLDNLNAQRLLSLESDKCAKSQRAKKRLQTALTKKNNHLIRTIRYLLNMVETDISQPPWDNWLQDLLDPILKLRVIAERQNTQFSDLTILENILHTIAETQHDHTACGYWLGELLQDANPQIVLLILEQLDTTHSALLEKQILSLLHNPMQPYEIQRTALVSLLRVQLASGREEAPGFITRCLQDGSEPGQVEDALNIVARFGLHEMADAVYEVGISDLSYSDKLRQKAQTILQQFEDQRYTAIEEKGIDEQKVAGIQQDYNSNTPPDSEAGVDSEPTIAFYTSLNDLLDPSVATDAFPHEEE